MVIGLDDDPWAITPSTGWIGAIVATGIGNVDRRSDDPFDDLAFGVTNLIDGAVFVVAGPITGPFAIDDVATRIDGPTGSAFGASVAGLGLVDGDPLDDFAVGAPLQSAGCVYLFGGDASLTAEVSLSFSDARDVYCGSGEDASYGEAVFAAGDLDADGQRDLAVSAAIVPLLPRSSRRAVALAQGLFTELSRRLRVTPAERLRTTRVRVPNPVKVRIALAAASGRLPS